MSNPTNNPPPLRQEGSELSDLSTAIGSESGLNQRHGYHRMPSDVSLDFTSNNLSNVSSLSDDPEPPAQGLGISGRPMSINRVPVGSRASLSPPTPSMPFHTPNISSNDSPVTPHTPGSSKPLLSPRFNRHGSDSFTYDRGGLEELREEDDISRMKATAIDEHEVENDGERISMHNDNDHTHLFNGCNSTRDIQASRASWLSISILMLSIYSTIFSGIWLAVSIAQPRYGRFIHSGGKFSPTTASTVFALLAKTIELSFVTVFVTFLGQVLTRRSLVKASRGVTIAELNMRTWVIQPGFILTHWQHVQHAIVSFLGVITLTAAVVAMFYTTASDSIVAPHLKYGKTQEMILKGLVKTSYANPEYIADSCQTPVTDEIDPDYAGSTCLSIEHAGQAYHNSLSYLSTWQGIEKAGTGASADLALRPPPVGTLYDNTTVSGSWVYTQTSNMTAAFKKYNRIVNNVTMSMPHAGVRTAAHDSENGILQPEELAGVGEYSLKASVVSPTVNILCVNMNSTEMEPLVYVDWPYATTVNDTKMPGQKIAWASYQDDVTKEFQKKPFLNSTVVDDIFQWGPNYGLAGRMPPVFPMVPIDYNSITNITVAQSDSNYLLIKSAATPDYTLCQIRAGVQSGCSTQYNVSGTQGGHLESHCDGHSDRMVYSRSVKDAPEFTIASDYRNIASQWLLSLSLNTGITNANASSGRLLSQFVPAFESWETVQLQPLMPSLAEMLAVLAGSTLLMSSMDSTYYHFWNYTSHVLDGEYQYFNATLASQQYASGPYARWQAIFYVVLILVFATNLFCLGYFLLRARLVTDYTEMQNLFALSINSPPSRRLTGSCGAGPKDEQLNIDWHVGQQEGTHHYFIKEGDPGSDFELRQRHHRTRGSSSSYGKLSSKRKSWL